MNKCPYLKNNPVCLCLAYTEGLKLPVLSEIKEYCLKGKFHKCPVFLNKEKVKKKVA